jgi:hypothetical protein
MENNISEEEQRRHFILNWNDPDIQLICEVPVFCRSVDLVKYNRIKNTVCAIEFKTKNWKRAVEQVMSTAISFDYVEICVRKPKTKKSQDAIIEYCSKIGVGVYFFIDKELKFEHALTPQKVDKIWNVQKYQVIDFIMKGETYAR